MKNANVLLSNIGASRHNAIIPKNWQYQYYQALFNFAQKRLTDTDTIRDLIQDTFLIAFETQSKFMGRCSEKTWLIAILKRLICDEYRRQAKEKRHLGRSMDVSDPNGLFSLHKYSALIERTKYDSGNDYVDLASEVITNGLKLIPATTKDILVKIYYDNQSVNSICEELKITNSNCYVICCRGKKLLRDFLIRHLMID